MQQLQFAANAVDTAATVGTDRAATYNRYNSNQRYQLMTQQITILQPDTTTVTDRSDTVNVVRLEPAVVPQEAVVPHQLLVIITMLTNTVTVVNNDLPATNNVVTDGLATSKKTIDGKQYYVEDDGTILKNYVLERNGGSQYFNAETGELFNQKDYRFDKNGGTGHQPTA